ncbi:unnamed protein product [Didymodactylos carnosus]|uniref:Histone-lysine N-methyltransferase, H3 lysine-79 specific n=1 Tax=Didymodactylos carnosus TaxID=1234261 RepID=A0A8S2MDC2_9BILA|nr:unnamed protein product [Didymodactylos carnosus]CAF3949378.1 unnamed protein product [Didymodactylos carnosus]
MLNFRVMKWFSKDPLEDLFSKKTEFKMSHDIRLVSPVGSDDAYVTVRWGNIESAENIISAIKFACKTIPELEIIAQNTLLKMNIDVTDLALVKAFAEAYNSITIDLLSKKNFKNDPEQFVTRDVLRFILKLCYEKSVTYTDNLQRNSTFSNQIYGEVSFELLDELMPKLAIKPDDVFIDLGSGMFILASDAF